MASILSDLGSFLRQEVPGSKLSEILRVLPYVAEEEALDASISKVWSQSFKCAWLAEAAEYSALSLAFLLDPEIDVGQLRALLASRDPLVILRRCFPPFSPGGDPQDTLIVSWVARVREVRDTLRHRSRETGKTFPLDWGGMEPLIWAGASTLIQQGLRAVMEVCAAAHAEPRYSPSPGPESKDLFWEQTACTLIESSRAFWRFRQAPQKP